MRSVNCAGSGGSCRVFSTARRDSEIEQRVAARLLDLDVGEHAVAADRELDYRLSRCALLLIPVGSDRPVIVAMYSGQQKLATSSAQPPALPPPESASPPNGTCAALGVTTRASPLLISGPVVGLLRRGLLDRLLDRASRRPSAWPRAPAQHLRRLAAAGARSPAWRRPALPPAPAPVIAVMPPVSGRAARPERDHHRRRFAPLAARAASRAGTKHERA